MGLFSSWLLSETSDTPLFLKNRVVMAPLTRGRAGEERLPNAVMAQYYAQRASTGLIISEATSISRQGLGWVDSPGIYTEQQADAWQQVTQAVHAVGGKMFLQLWHCGRASHTSFHPELGAPVSASALPITGNGRMGDQIRTPEGKQPYETPRPLSITDIQAVIEDYRQAARRAKAAGFDGVEIHSANGYLLDQFLQDKTNHRTDAYGGSVENRQRLLMEVIAAIATEWPAARIGVRLSPNGMFNDMGDSNPRALFLSLLQRLAPLGLAYVHIMDGLGFGFHGNGSPITLAECRAVYPGTIIGNVGYDLTTAEQTLAAGVADAIAFGRPLITNPDLVERLQHGWPLAPFEDMSTWYTPGAAGYTDYPTYCPAIPDALMCSTPLAGIS